MEILKKVSEILLMSDDKKKELQIEELGDHIEYAKKVQDEDLINGVSLLLEYGLKLNLSTLKEAIFSTIFTAVLNHDIAANINWDALANSLLSLDEECLDYSLSFLGFSRNKKYVDVISKCLNSANDDIRESAKEALHEINSQLSS